jgi:hypothetical protein
MSILIRPRAEHGAPYDDVMDAPDDLIRVGKVLVVGRREAGAYF